MTQSWLTHMAIALADSVIPSAKNLSAIVERY
jgi:hypothetical protein